MARTSLAGNHEGGHGQFAVVPHAGRLKALLAVDDLIAGLVPTGPVAAAQSAFQRSLMMMLGIGVPDSHDRTSSIR